VKRLPADKSVFDLFGIDLEKGTVRGLEGPSERAAKTQIGSRYKDSPEAFVRLAKWHQDHRVGLTVASFAVAIVGTAILVRVASAPSAAADVGARLVVHTPRGEPGRLRASASLAGKVIAVLPAGTEVAVLGAAPSWYRLSTPKGDGWMHSDIVRAA
jgi:hypothetical protein